ncbi:MAG: hypothetical protein J6S13_07250 [Clostridia bacterium]|nr:hypothetical protein [Clostridia bacterium]
MGFFTSPKKLIEVITSHEKMAYLGKPRTPEWYRSPEGKKAYDALKTQSDKVEYFYLYLLSLYKHEDKGFKDLYNIAYIMMAGMDGTSKPYGTWPGILLPENNPLVAFIESGEYLTDNTSLPDLTVSRLICALHEGWDYKYYCKHMRENFDTLTKYEDDPDLFLLEQLIIFTFCHYPNDYLQVGPYHYSPYDDNIEDDDVDTDEDEGYEDYEEDEDYE